MNYIIDEKKFIEKSNVIGIIGGAGVAATNKLSELIEIELTKNGAYRDCHHPEIIMWQATHVPSRSMYLEGKGESFIPSYIEIAKKLKNCGANKIAMCCNTAHYAIEEIMHQADIPFINIVEACVMKIQEKNISKVGLIASDGCLKGKVYEKYFNKYCPNVEVIYPDENYQKMVTKGICNIKSRCRFDKTNIDEYPEYLFKKIKKHLMDKKAQVVIIGCTDIRVAYFEHGNIDSLEVLKELIIKEFGANKYVTENEYSKINKI